MMMTTLNKIRSHGPCRDGWEKLLRHLSKTAADDEPLSLETILNSNGLQDAFWCLRAVTGYDRELRLYAVWAARQVQHLMTDPRSIAALDVAEHYARGRVSDAELSAARLAARVAAAAAARSAALAAWAAWAAARAAAREAESAALAAESATAAAAESAREAAREAQAAEFRRMCREGYP